MRAILFLKGRSLSIYTLAIGAGDKSEVRDFLEQEEPSIKGTLHGFRVAIEYLAVVGVAQMPSKIVKQFRPKKRSVMLHQIHKGDYRIACYHFGQLRRLLLATVFPKDQRLQIQEYDRALSRIRDFLANPDWVEE